MEIIFLSYMLIERRVHFQSLWLSEKSHFWKFLNFPLIKWIEFMIYVGFFLIIKSLAHMQANNKNILL